MKTVNLLKCVAALLCLSIMMYFLVDAIRPENASAEENSSEMRAVWVATVFGLDFPSGYTGKAGELREKIDEIMENCQKAGFNTVFLQVRPACDAFYKSEIFPWSKYLTGTQGKAPSDGFDPLSYAIESAHKRGLSLHAWINPYRVTVSAGDESGFSQDNPAKIHGEYTVTHSDGKIYFDPGLPQVRQLIVDGAAEIVKNYEVDGIHLDDYFYPEGNFADSETHATYGKDFDNIDDWRRDNVTTLIRELSEAIHSANPAAMFSVSPSGIWANKENQEDGSLTSGSESYSSAYADTRLWVKEGLIDCIIPQIYWERGYEIADFSVLVNWWSDLVTNTNVKLCIGLAAYKASDAGDPLSKWYGENGIEELRAQIDFCRMKETSGYAMYRYGSVFSTSGILNMVKEMNKTTEPSAVFTDINEFSWAKDAITALYEKGVVKGFEDGSFGGGKMVTRADFTVMLLRAAEKTADFDENFDDVSESDYFYRETGIAKALGYIDGTGDNKFNPRNNISRQDMAVIAYRVLKTDGAVEDAAWSDDSFTDGESIDGYARMAVAALSKAGIINGYPDGTFSPAANATRAETAVMIHRIYEILNKSVSP